MCFRISYQAVNFEIPEAWLEAANAVGFDTRRVGVATRAKRSQEPSRPGWLRKEDAVSGNPIPENELLVSFESQNLPAEYKEYYLAKRQNLFASIQGYSETFDCYMLLDRIWFREFQDIKVTGTPDRMFPLLLYFNEHAKIRVSIELALSGCLAEARSILRDSIEFVAHAHHMLGDPTLQVKWLSKNEEEEAFKEAFERNKKTGLFNGLDELHKSWGDLSETGSHANINAICDRFAMVEEGKTVEWRLRYCGIEPHMWERQLFWMLLICFTMEQTLFRDYESRLKFDDTLLRMRAEFEHRKEHLRKDLIVRLEVPPPAAPAVSLQCPQMQISE
jgi:hypothetical protein